MLIFLPFTAVNGKFCLLQYMHNCKKSEEQRKHIFYMALKWSDPGTLNFFGKISHINCNDTSSFGKNDALIMNLNICIFQGSDVYRGKFTAGFTATYTIKNGDKKVTISAIAVETLMFTKFQLSTISCSWVINILISFSHFKLPTCCW